MSRLGTIGGIFFGHNDIDDAVAPVGENFYTERHCVGNLHGMAETLGYINAEHGYEEHKWVLPATARLASLRKDCEHEIERIVNAEQDRTLTNEESLSNIKYGRKGYKLSIIAIIVSGIAILLELAKWIWPK